MENSDKLTSAQMELLALLAEECGECIQVVGKILRFGYTSLEPGTGEVYDNKELLVKELGDIRLAMEFLFESGEISPMSVKKRLDEKRQKIAPYLRHQSSQ